MNTRLSAVTRIGCAAIVGFFFAASSYADDVYINPRYPIGTEKNPGLSPPRVHQTNECATHVYVDSFVPKATIKVFRSGTLIGGPVVPQFGFAAVDVSPPLKVGDKITATQTVNGVTSAASAPMVVSVMPSTLPPPTVGPAIYACGRVVPVTGLTSGVTVQVNDATAGTNIGNGFTPNNWGDNWAPVGTSSLKSGDKISATQQACTGVASQPSPQQPVNPDPTHINPPTVETPIVGNDAITLQKLFTGAEVSASDHNTGIGAGLATGASNWMSVHPNIPANASITAEQQLCSSSGPSAPVVAVSQLPPPLLVGPICPGQQAVVVRNTTINATLVLLQNGTVVGYGGAEPGDVVLGVAPPHAFATGDTIRVVEYIGSIIADSNTVTVQCFPQNVVTQHNNNARQGAQLYETILTPSNVAGPNFGLLYDRAVLGTLLAQPLYVHGVNIKNQVRNVIFVATAEDVVYAFDADDTSVDTTANANAHSNTGTLVSVPESTKWLWRTSLGAPHVGNICAETVPPIVGITSTPVIDVSAGVMYVVARDQGNDSGMGHDYLHALSIETGQNLRTQQVQASDPLHGLVFNDACERQRPGLLLQNGVIYLGYGTYQCDNGCPNNEPYRGWIIGFNATDFSPAGVFTNSQSYGEGGMGVWASGNGLAGSEDGSIFYQTGNDIDPNENLAALGDSFVKLQGNGSSLAIVAHYQPPAAINYKAGDTDLGAGGPMLLPNGKLIGGGKDGMLFLLSQSDLTLSTSFQAFFNTFHLPTPGTPNLDPSDAVIPVPYPNAPATYATACTPAAPTGNVANPGDPCYIDVSYYKNGESYGPNIHTGPVFWQNSANHGFIYKMSEKDYLKAFDYDINAGTVNPTPAAYATVRPAHDGMPGGFSSISANGQKDGVVWTVVQQLNNMWNAPTAALLYANDATTLKQLWNNSDNPATFAKFAAPTIADGRVILPSVGYFRVYGISTPFAGQAKVKLPLEAAVQQRWLDGGGELGLLGHPQGDLQRDADTGGLRQDFQTLIGGGGFGNVSVPPSVKIAVAMCDTPDPMQPDLPVAVSLFASPTTGVHYVIGEIRDKFLQSGGTKQFGYPVTDEVATPDGLGLMTRFERGTIYWYPGHNAEIGEPTPPPIQPSPAK
jgi:hypothetical protein